MASIAFDIDELKRHIGRVRRPPTSPPPALPMPFAWPSARPEPQMTVGDPIPPGWQILDSCRVSRRTPCAPTAARAMPASCPRSPLPRCMFAGERLRFHRPIRIGERSRARDRAQRHLGEVGRHRHARVRDGDEPDPRERLPRGGRGAAHGISRRGVVWRGRIRRPSGDTCSPMSRGADASRRILCGSSASRRSRSTATASTTTGRGQGPRGLRRPRRPRAAHVYTADRLRPRREPGPNVPELHHASARPALRHGPVRAAWLPHRQWSRRGTLGGDPRRNGGNERLRPSSPSGRPAARPRAARGAAARCPRRGIRLLDARWHQDGVAGHHRHFLSFDRHDTTALEEAVDLLDVRRSRWPCWSRSPPVVRGGPPTSVRSSQMSNLTPRRLWCRKKDRRTMAPSPPCTCACRRKPGVGLLPVARHREPSRAIARILPAQGMNEPGPEDEAAYGRGPRYMARLLVDDFTGACRRRAAPDAPFVRRSPPRSSGSATRIIARRSRSA